MRQMDMEQLAHVVVQVPNYSALTPAERTEVFRVAQGYRCKDSAGVANNSPETIRARRKRIYGKLGISGCNEVIAALLACSLRMLAAATQSLEPTASRAAPSPAELH
jgi:DNA-binding CsgD family transcriptional regulator